MVAKKSVAGGVIIDNRTLDFTVPKELLDIYRERPRVILKKAEWYGIHPLPLDVLSPELRRLAKNYEFIAVPKRMMQG